MGKSPVKLSGHGERQGRPKNREGGGGRRLEDQPSAETLSANTEYGLQKGECMPGACGPEAACKRFSNSTYVCICPHDSSQPKADLTCPNRLTVPLTPRPIHNIIPPSGLNITGPRSSIGSTNHTAYSNITRIYNTTTSTEMAERSNRLTPSPDFSLTTGVVSTLTILVTLVFLMSAVCWWKSRTLTAIRKDKGNRKTEALHTGEPLLPERYIANPQYTTAGSGGMEDQRNAGVGLLPRECLTLVEDIGEGCFGKVYRGELRIDGGHPKTVAIKLLKDNATRTAEDDFIREVNIMSAFHHQNILTLIGVVQKAEGGLNPWMVFEYMPFGDLAGVLRSNSQAMRQQIQGLQPLDRRSLLSIALQISCGIQYLAAQRFVHRDLACRNCLVGENLTVKIADFGMSRDVYTSDYYKMDGNRPMPIRWMSPESIQYARFTLESDVWSYGVVLWEIYSLGKQPYYGHNNDGASKLIIQGIMLIPPQDCPTFICELMRACWRTDPKDRICFQDICAKLEGVQEDGGWDGSGGFDGTVRHEQAAWTMTMERRGGSKWSTDSGRLPRPPADLPVSAPSLQAPPELTDGEGYLLPAKPVLISEYLATLPD